MVPILAAVWRSKLWKDRLFAEVFGDGACLELMCACVELMCACVEFMCAILCMYYCVCTVTKPSLELAWLNPHIFKHEATCTKHVLLQHLWGSCSLCHSITPISSFHFVKENKGCEWGQNVMKCSLAPMFTMTWHVGLCSLCLPQLVLWCNFYVPLQLLFSKFLLSSVG